MSGSRESPRRTRPAGIAAPSDRRFHRAGLRPDQRRVGRTIVRVTKWIAGLAVVAVAGIWLTDVVLHARMLTVQHVRVRGNVRLSEGDVQTLMQGVQGENIFRVDFEPYRQRVLDSPFGGAFLLTGHIAYPPDSYLGGAAPLQYRVWADSGGSWQKLTYPFGVTETYSRVSTDPRVLTLSNPFPADRRGFSDQQAEDVAFYMNEMWG